MKIKMKSKKMRGVMSAAALLLALTLPSAAHGQSDGFFNNADGFFSNADGGVRDGDVGGGQEATWEGMKSNESPVGGGLLVLTAAGLCYAGAKKVKRVESKE